MHRSLKKLLEQPPHIEHHGPYTIVREDLMPGGSKMRFLPYIVPANKELVFGGPFCGGAPLALSEIGKRTGQKITLFYAKRAVLHPRQKLAKANGAKLIYVSPGYMTNVQAKARAYAVAKGAFFFELGFDMPGVAEPFLAFMARVREIVGDPPEVWCAAGSGMLARTLGQAFPKSKVIGVAVGLKSQHSEQEYPENVEIRDSGYPFQKECNVHVPFPSCPNYDRKAWALMCAEGKKGAMMWNVL